MKKFSLFLLLLGIFLGLCACKAQTLEDALDRADALVSGWNSTNLNHYAYTASYQEAQNAYCVRMTILAPASADQSTALHSRDVVAAGVNAVLPELEACFRAMDEVDIIFEIYDESGTLLYMFLNNIV